MEHYVVIDEFGIPYLYTDLDISKDLFDNQISNSTFTAQRTRQRDARNDKERARKRHIVNEGIRSGNLIEKSV